MKCVATKRNGHNGHFAICVGNRGYSASLELRKIYQVLPDKAVQKLHQIRIIDESGEDYLYPKDFFVPVKLPEAVEQAVRRANAQSHFGWGMASAMPKTRTNLDGSSRRGDL